VYCNCSSFSMFCSVFFFVLGTTLTGTYLHITFCVPSTPSTFVCHYATSSLVRGTAGSSNRSCLGIWSSLFYQLVTSFVVPVVAVSRERNSDEKFQLLWGYQLVSGSDITVHCVDSRQLPSEVWRVRVHTWYLCVVCVCVCVCVFFNFIY